MRLPAASSRSAGWLRSADGTLAEVPRNVRANMAVSPAGRPRPAPRTISPSPMPREQQCVQPHRRAIERSKQCVASELAAKPDLRRDPPIKRLESGRHEPPAEQLGAHEIADE